MDELKNELALWGESLRDFYLPRWQELPDLDLYMDQVIQLVDQYLMLVIQTEKHPLLTPAMVNNYVKKGLIPAPIKKRYQRKHLAFLIAITLLKQVITIPEVKSGILFQGKVSGIREAYDLFCDEQEKSIQFIINQAQLNTINLAIPIELDRIAVQAATRAFANKLLAEKMIILQEKYILTGDENYEQ
ncbi:MAG TPA: DUF1836 domain-containing protein [Candidatus Enterococcus stercoripullorum]|nr:DUF1836 domain-containing protein [Candidatus Enterococcus stercoripullorum]